MSLKSSTNTKANTYELILEVDAAAFDAAVENVYKRQKKNISVPGFRKGKVTRKFAEKYFGENAFLGRCNQCSLQQRSCCCS